MDNKYNGLATKDMANEKEVDGEEDGEMTSGSLQEQRPELQASRN